MGAVETNADIRRVANGTFVSEKNLPARAAQTVCFEFSFLRVVFQSAFLAGSLNIQPFFFLFRFHCCQYRAEARRARGS